MDLADSAIVMNLVDHCRDASVLALAISRHSRVNLGFGLPLVDGNKLLVVLVREKGVEETELHIDFLLGSLFNCRSIEFDGAVHLLGVSNQQGAFTLGLAPVLDANSAAESMKLVRLYAPDYNAYDCNSNHNRKTMVILHDVSFRILI